MLLTKYCPLTLATGEIEDLPQQIDSSSCFEMIWVLRRVTMQTRKARRRATQARSYSNLLKALGGANSFWMGRNKSAITTLESKYWFESLMSIFDYVAFPLILLWRSSTAEWMMVCESIKVKKRQTCISTSPVDATVSNVFESIQVKKRRTYISTSPVDATVSNIVNTHRALIVNYGNHHTV